MLVFHAKWSGGVVMLRRLLAQVEEDYSTLSISWVNTEENVALSHDLKVNHVPTVILLRHGEIVEYVAKMLPLREWMRLIRPYS